MNMMRDATGPLHSGQTKPSHYNVIQISNTRILHFDIQKR
jgi:hypothetical protein